MELFRQKLGKIYRFFYNRSNYLYKKDKKNDNKDDNIHKAKL